MLATVAVQMAVFALLFLPRPSRLSDTSRTILDGALLTVFMVLFPPSCWVATYSALILPVFVALTLFFARPQETSRHFSLAVSALTTVGLSLLTHSKVWRFLNVLQIRGETYVYLVLMILPWFGLCLASYLWHQRRLVANRL